jgi:alanine racemase
MSRPITATISIAALRHNLARVRELAPAARIWAVVKANAYGHGIAPAMTAFSDADGLALVEFDKARQLRAAGWTKPILMLEGAFDEGDVEQARHDALSLVVHEPRQLGWLEHVPSDAPIPVYLKFNSGMSRLGFDEAGLLAAHARVRAMTGVSFLGFVSHFANADLSGGADEAIARFDAATIGLEGERSLANSAAVIGVPAAHRDWVRPGVMLYGASPYADRSAAHCGLRPAMELASALIAVRELSPGDAVGYGSTFVADRPMRIGVVACGYADGYPRHAPTGTPIAVAGRLTRTVGRVSMDMLTVDLEPVPHARPGDPVELWGGAQVDIDAVAAAAGTIGYELMCALAPRVPVLIGGR